MNIIKLYVKKLNTLSPVRRLLSIFSLVIIIFTFGFIIINFNTLYTVVETRNYSGCIEVYVNGKINTTPCKANNNYPVNWAGKEIKWNLTSINLTL